MGTFAEESILRRMRKIFLIFSWVIFGTLNAQDVELILPLGHAEGIQTVDYSENGKYILTRGFDNSSILWSAVTGKQIYLISDPEYKVNSSYFMGEGEKLILICSDGKLRILKTESVETLVTISYVRTDLCTPKVSADGNYIVGIDSKYFISVWRTIDGKKINTFDKTDGGKYYAKWSAPCNTDKGGAEFICVWKRTTPGIFFINFPKQKTIISSDSLTFYNRTEFDSEVGFLVTTNNGQFTFWDINLGNELFKFGNLERSVEDIYINKKRKNFILSYSDGSYELRSLSDRILIKEHIGFSSSALNSSRVYYTPNHEKYFIYSPNKKLTAFESVTGNVSKEYATIPDNEGIFRFSPPSNDDSLGNKYLLQSENIVFYQPKICLYDLSTSKKLVEVYTKPGWVHKAMFSPDGKKILVESAGRMEIWDIQSLKRKHVLEGSTINISEFNFRNEEKNEKFTKEILTVCKDTVARIIDLINLKVSKKFVGHKDKLHEAIYSKNAKYVITGGGSTNYDSHKTPEDVIKVWDLLSEKEIGELKGHQSAVVSMDLSSDGKKLSSLDYRGDWKIWDFENKKMLIGYHNHGFMRKILFHPSDSIIGVAHQDDARVKLFSLKNGREKKAYWLFFSHTYDFNFDKKGNSILISGHYDVSGSAAIIHLDNDSVAYLGKSYSDTISGRYNYERGINSSINSICFNSDETRFLTANSNRKSEVWGLDGKKKIELKSHTSDVKYARYTPDYRKIITCGDDNIVKIWDAESGEEKVSIVLFKSEDVLAFTPDKYYFANKKIAQQLSWKKGGDFYSFDQFDLKFNRPDVVLERLGYADDKLIKAYHQAYLKRLKKMNFTEEMLKDDFHLPEVKIENFEFIPEITNEDSLNLNLNLYDSKYPLDRINIYINDVPVFGVAGVDLRQFNTKEYKTNIAVKLAEGENSIQVSVLNQAGAESYKQHFEIVSHKKAEKHDLYLLCIGVSKYQDSAFNLSYADKDAKDISALYSASKNYDKVHFKTLLNEEVTLENVLAAKAFVQQAGRNDEVVVFVAGHGVLDKNFDYYFASYDMDFSYPSQKGIPYDKVEGLLDGISPLKKVMLIDACHSGEVDKDELELASVVTKESGSVKFRKVGNGVQPKLGSDNSFELVKSLFTDLRKGTGTTVISSAGGLEFAMESGSWKNGLFTYCLMNGIKSKTADLNKDGNIMLSELQEYLQNEVSKLSGGNQQPTSRFENLQGDFKVW